jgi:YgiT-type zinc finger domain-containing protein
MEKGKQVGEKCPLCGGTVEPGRTTFTADIGTGVVVVRGVPARVCSTCGESWLGDETARSLERTVEKARKEKHEVEVLPFTP